MVSLTNHDNEHEVTLRQAQGDIKNRNYDPPTERLYNKKAFLLQDKPLNYCIMFTYEIG